MDGKSYKQTLVEYLGKISFFFKKNLTWIKSCYIVICVSDGLGSRQCYLTELDLEYQY